MPMLAITMGHRYWVRTPAPRTWWGRFLRFDSGAAQKTIRKDFETIGIAPGTPLES